MSTPTTNKPDAIADIFVKLDNWYRYMQGKSIDADVGMMSHSEALAAIYKEIERVTLDVIKQAELRGARDALQNLIDNDLFVHTDYTEDGTELRHNVVELEVIEKKIREFDRLLQNMGGRSDDRAP